MAQNQQQQQQQQWRTPLYDALAQHARSNPVSFHVPGHHQGEALQYGLEKAGQHKSGIEDCFAPLLALDVTELSSTDDLHHPEASIQEAQRLAAACFGSEDTYFLVGGSTSGNLALILTVCQPGDTIIVQRNVHKSIINGLRLAGAKAVFLYPEYEPHTQLATIPSIQQVEEALMMVPEAKAVFLSTPNYYGMSVRLDDYIARCRSAGIPLLVDEAHGAHYGFHPQLPTSAIQAGADAVVQSTHKTLPAMTMGAMLHVQGQRIDRERLRETLAMLQSSSPSFPILASLDIARAIVQSAGEALYQESIEAVQQFRRWLQGSSLRWTMPGQGASDECAHSAIAYDPLRILLTDGTGALSGYELQQELERHGCYAELADPQYVLLVVGPHAGREALPRLKEALVHIHSSVAPSTGVAATNPAQAVKADAAISRSELVSFTRSTRASKQRVKLLGALNQLSGEMVVPYPPGIPVLYTGERISSEHIAHIERLARSGARFQGAKDEAMETIAIIIEEKC
ncbi:aminotransferase class I/II-fold pyridoxal phosphate-dependent enzyme [Paenibacillus sp. PL2-23]|uniref:aminotransferase class I/II-fold pyridoxal phosphate-dependent enzyme n=1 Tax=Paenibacillus sp. PL2-23 TaxID=2100729 RepID=UPI0030FAACFE